MIARAWYVMCDGCGNPAEISTSSGKEAREYAKACDGFVRVKVDGRLRDLCPACNPKDPRR